MDVGTGDGSRSRVPGTALALAVVAATWLAYLPSLDGGHYYDEETAILSNWAIRSPAAAFRQLRPETLLGPARPVTDLTYALDFVRGGLAPRAFHETELALHLVAVALVLAFVLGALRVSGHRRAGALAAAVAVTFAFHPLQAETVCYPAQRSEALASVLYLAALMALLRAEAAWPRRTAWGWLAGGTLLHAGALGAKSIAVTLPAAFVAYRVVLGGGPPGAEPVRRRLLRALALSAPAWALSIVAVARNLSALGPADSAGLHAGALGPARYFLTEWRVLWLYARLAAWPSGLNVDHDLAPCPGLLDGATLAAGLGLAAVVGGAVTLWRRAERGRGSAAGRAVAFGVAWWLLLLVPTSTVIPIADTVAEHRVYLALAGLSLAAWVAADAALSRLLPEPRAGRALAAAAFLACAPLWIALHGRARVWSSPVELWGDAVAGSPAKARTLTNYAYALQAAGRTREAIAWYGRASAAATSPKEAAEVARNLSGLYLDALGDPAGAVAVLDPVLSLLPGHYQLRRNRALAWLALGRIDEAWADAAVALVRAPDAPELQDLVGVLHVARGELEEAEVAFRRARRIDPAEPTFVEHHFLALFHLGRRAEACAAWSDLVRGGASPGADARRRAEEARCVP